MARFACVGVLLAALAGLVSAQAPDAYRARLGVVPVDAATLPTISGSGTVTATIKGAQLSLTGTFTGLQSPATVARIHIAPRGIRGPSTLELTVTRGTSGTIRGEFTLTAAQIDHLRRGRLYVQLHSEKAPEGNLWGWLLP